MNNNFTFSNPIHNEGNNNLKKKKNGSDGAMENYESWAERIRGGGQHRNFGRPDDASFGAWNRRIPDEGDENGSGTPSPELWRKAERSPERRPNHGHYYRDADNPRAQNIARYRQEMLDLVRGMPETAYELSLRDLVESPEMTTPLKEEDGGETKKIRRKKGKTGARRTPRSESLDKGGLMLKMFIPRIPNIAFGGKSGNGSKSKSTGAKVSPKPVLGDREWWNGEVGAMSRSGGSSSSSSSSNGSGNRSRKPLGCYPFF